MIDLLRCVAALGASPEAEDAWRRSRGRLAFEGPRMGILTFARHTHPGLYHGPDAPHELVALEGEERARIARLVRQ